MWGYLYLISYDLLRQKHWHRYGYYFLPAIRSFRCASLVANRLLLGWITVAMLHQLLHLFCSANDLLSWKPDMEASECVV